MRESAMRTIDVDDELYHFIASNTRHIGESASAILRRLLALDALTSNDDAPLTVADSSVVEQLIAVLAAGGKQRERFLNGLSVLARHAPRQFTQLLDLRGSRRRYFSLSLDELLANGSSTRPCAIPGTPFFVVTNANGAKKARLLDQAMSYCGLSAPERAQALVAARFSVSEET